MSTFTPSLQLENPAIGATGWGVSENTSRSLIDNYTAGIETLSVAGNSNVVLSSTQGAADQSRWSHFIFTGALTGNIVVLFPNGLTRNFTANNATTGAFTLSVGVNNGSSLPAGTTVAVPAGLTAFLLSDGTNITPRFNAFSALTLTTALNAASGGTGQTTYTDGQLLIGDSSTSGLDKATLTAGTGITITNGHGTITIAAPGGGVASIADATNGGLHFSAATGAITANIAPSDLLTKATPTTSDSVVIMDAAASNVPKTSTLSSVLALSVLTKSYDSGNQTITGGGLLTLAHGFGVKPKTLSIYMVNVTPEGGFTTGQEMLLGIRTNAGPEYSGLNTPAGYAEGIAVVSDATNINVRIGTSFPWFAVRFDDGGVFTPTTANWNLIFRAYA